MRPETIPVRCASVAGSVAAVADRGELDGIGPTEREHIGTCLRCQADLVQYRRLLRALRGLREDVFQPAPGLLGDIFAALEEAGERHAVRSALQGRRAAYLGGIAAATAAGAAGAIVYATRSRRLRPAG